MTDETAVLEADRQFDVAVVRGDSDALDRLLADDFLLIDLQGSTATKAAFLEVIGSGQLQFQTLDASAVLVRIYGVAAIVTGITEMEARQGESSFAGRSRFTHVYVRQPAKQPGEWRMVAAQGTIIP